MKSLPSILLDLKTVQKYCDGDRFSVRQTDDKLILDFLSENEYGGEWEEDLRLNSFLSLRTDLIRGDLRCLYLGWLSSLQNDEYDEEEFEPAIPPGLRNLNPALTQLADFLRIDFDLINAAAHMSPSLEDMTPNSQDLQRWLYTLSPNERDSMLTAILESSLKGDQTIALQQICRFSKVWQSFQEIKKENPKKRTVGQLPEIRKPIEWNGKKQWYFTKSCHIPNIDHKVRILILWNKKNERDPVKILVTNRIKWEVRRIQSAYKKRWSGTETFHRDGKQYLGMGECQLRSGQSQTRHMYLVILAHSLLVSILKKNHPCEWAKITLNTIGEACRFVLKETLGMTISWVIEEITEKHKKKADIMTALKLVPT